MRVLPENVGCLGMLEDNCRTSKGKHEEEELVPRMLSSGIGIIKPIEVISNHGAYM
jgi:hypothetical protein